jgi:hypothetical protein
LDRRGCDSGVMRPGLWCAHPPRYPRLPNGAVAPAARGSPHACARHARKSASDADRRASTGMGMWPTPVLPVLREVDATGGQSGHYELARPAGESGRFRAAPTGARVGDARFAGVAHSRCSGS